MKDYDFDLDTTSTPAGPGRRDTIVTDRWHTPNKTPNGGYVLGLMLRGLVPEMSLPDPVVASITYFKPAAVGPAQLSSQVLRSGRRLATGETTLTQGDSQIAKLVASFADRSSGTGRNAEFGTPPTLPAPDDCPEAIPSRVFDGISIGDRVDYRFATLPGWASGSPTGAPTAEYWVRFSDRRPVDRLGLAFLVDAFPPAVLEIGEFAAVTVQLTVHLHRVPVSEWLACSLRTNHVIDGYHEEDMEIWDEEGTLVAQSRQLALLL